MDNRTEYIESLSVQRVEWGVQIDLLKNRLKSAPSGKKYELAKAVALLQQKRDEAAVKLQRISAADKDEWEDLITDEEHVLNEVRSLLRDTIMKID